MIIHGRTGDNNIVACLCRQMRVARPKDGLISSSYYTWDLLMYVCVAVWNSARQQSVKDHESVVALKRAVCWGNPQTTSGLLGLLGLLGQQN